MRQTFHIENLRTMDPQTLEVMVQDALRKPITALSCGTIADLMAWSEVESLSKPLRRDLITFGRRIAMEFVDLPDPKGLVGSMEEIDSLGAERIPTTLRAIVDKECTREGRSGTVSEMARTLVARWSDTQPAPIVPPQSKLRVQRAEAVPSRDDLSNRKGIRRASDSTSSRRKRSTNTAKPTPRPRPVEDIERTRWIRTTLLEKLSQRGENGLAEPVLIAGLRHQARATYPGLMSHEIVRVLKQLMDAGQLRKTGNRWSVPGLRW